MSPATAASNDAGLFTGFERRRLATSRGLVNAVVGGSGPPVLLLHGYPESLLMWHAVAPLLREHHTVVATDLAGYGGSFLPRPAADHRPHAKREMARDQVEAMAGLGFDSFAVVGHDRGGRVAYRMALDHPAGVERLAVLDIVPTGEVWRRADADLALGYWHWAFLALPAPLPERLIGGDPDAFFDLHVRAQLGMGSDPERYPARCWTNYRRGSTTRRRRRDVRGLPGGSDRRRRARHADPGRAANRVPRTGPVGGPWWAAAFYRDVSTSGGRGPLEFRERDRRRPLSRRGPSRANGRAAARVPVRDRPGSPAMRILVADGGGPLGPKLVARLQGAGHTALRHPDPGAAESGSDELGNAIFGADVVIQVPDSPFVAGRSPERLTDATRKLLAAEARAGVAHHLMLSVAGTERLTESPHFRAGILQEDLVREAATPHTIIQATQLFESVHEIALAAMDRGIVRLAPIPVEPLAGDDVASVVCGPCEREPRNETVEIGGPERFLLDQFVRHGLLAQGEPHTVVPDPAARYLGAELHEQDPAPGPGGLPRDVRFHDWLLRRPVAPQV